MKGTCLFCILLACTFLLGCDDEEPGPQGETGQITIEFDNRVGEENLELNRDYTNSSGETFRVTKLNYYISNIALKTKDGREFKVPQESSYFLIMEEEKESQEVTLKNVPAGDYSQIIFTIGVDSLRSTMDISRRTGVLDPAQGHDGMYWTSTLGYIFFKMEGTSPAVTNDQDNKFYYHIGGFGAGEAPRLNNIQKTLIEMGDAVALVRSNKAPEVHLHVDILEVFKNPSAIRIADHPVVTFVDYSKTVSANYVDMFKYDHVHN